ncbi:MAG: hypothetical protein KF770_14505 [Anaerolineae bacterium]|nr:hypothetical protein [Anaerolineae bacterium]
MEKGTDFGVGTAVFLHIVVVYGRSPSRNCGGETAVPVDDTAVFLRSVEVGNGRFPSRNCGGERPFLLWIRPFSFM